MTDEVRPHHANKVGPLRLRIKTLTSIHMQNNVEHGNANAVEKVHPATREILPDDPMNLNGTIIDGDAKLMLVMIIEEFARMGWRTEQIIEAANNPFYQALNGLIHQLGEDTFRNQIDLVLQRMGVSRITITETNDQPNELHQIDVNH